MNLERQSSFAVAVTNLKFSISSLLHQQYNIPALFRFLHTDSHNFINQTHSSHSFHKTRYTSILRLACIQFLFSESSIWSGRLSKIPKRRRDLLLQVFIRDDKRSLLVPARQEDFLINTHIQFVEAADDVS
jgi:hypothetical protein